MLSNNLSNLWSSIIIDELIKSNVTDFFISPGMRSAPLVNSLLSKTDVNLYIGIDERAQAYRALGSAKTTGRTSTLICTSGTALANYLPAIIEAKKSAIPMIVLSADRPIELSSSDANQTIDQTKFYAQHVMTDACLGAPTEQIGPEVIRNTINHLLFRSLYPNKGPVHFNIPLREPLDETLEEISDAYISKCKLSFEKKMQTSYRSPIQSLESEVIEQVANLIENTEEGILVIGSLNPSMPKEEVKKFIKNLNWPKHIDISSSLKFNYSLDDQIIPTFDHPEVFDTLTKNPPKTIIHLGGRTTSKHYYRFIEENPEIELITINWSEQKEDPSQMTDMRIVSQVDQFCSQMNKKSFTSTSRINIDWKEFVTKKISLIDSAPLCYPYISKNIVEILREDSLLYISNSTIVRSFDNYISKDSKKSLRILTNRGVSGIEGLMASAIGSAEGCKKYTTLVIGDISFLHDLNSLQMLKETNASLCIVLINNSGGGIFTLLPIAKNEKLLPYLTTPHNFNFKKNCEGFDLKHVEVTTSEEFTKQFTMAQEKEEKIIIEVKVDNDQNIEIYKQLKTLKL